MRAYTLVGHGEWSRELYGYTEESCESSGLIWLHNTSVNSFDAEYCVDEFNAFLPFCQQDIDGLVQDCSNSIANALELLQSCTKPLIYTCNKHLCSISVPDAPRNFGNVSRSQTSLSLQWDDPLKANGILKQYRVSEFYRNQAGPALENMHIGFLLHPYCIKIKNI